MGELLTHSRNHTRRDMLGDGPQPRGRAHRDIAAPWWSSCCFLPGTGATVTHLARPRRRLKSSATLGRARPPPASPPQGHTYAVPTSGLAADRVTIGTPAERDTDLSATFCEPTVLAKQGLRVPVAGPGTRESPQERPGSPHGPVPTPVSAQRCVRPGLPSLTPGLARQWHSVGCPVCPSLGMPRVTTQGRESSAPRCLCHAWARPPHVEKDARHSQFESPCSRSCCDHDFP